MNESVAYVVAALAVAIAVFAGLHTLTNRLFSNALFYAIAALEVVLLGVLVGGCIALSGTDREVNGALFVSYLITVAIIPPVAVLWGISEKSRWGTGVVVIAMLSVAVLCFRLLGIWQGRYV